MAWQKRGENAEGGKFPGGTWHIFPHVVEKAYIDGEIVDRALWRAVVAIRRTGKMYWKASRDKRIVELWLRDKIKEVRELKTPKVREERDGKAEKKRKKNKKNADVYLASLHTRKKEKY